MVSSASGLCKEVKIIVEYIRYELKEHPLESLVEAYAKAGAHLQAAPECLGYELAAARDAPSSFTLRILWTSADSHLQGFRKGPNFPPFVQLVRPFIAEIAEMRHYAGVGVEWSR